VRCRCIAISYGAVVEETCGYDEEYHFRVQVYTLCCVVLCCVVYLFVDTHYIEYFIWLMR
jgi:hypothetical protein